MRGRKRYTQRKRFKSAGRRKYGRRGTDISTRTLAARTVGQRRSRMLPRRAWRSLLWKDTLPLQKYKAILSANQTFNTIATGGSEASYVVETMDNSQPFWTGAGGLLPVTNGGTVPVLSPYKLVVRGGSIWISLTNNPESTDDVEVTVQWVYPRQQTTRYNSLTRTNNPLTDWIAGWLAGTYPLGVRAQNIADYEQYFHPPMREKTIILKPGDSFRDSINLRIKRIDSESFQNGFDQFARVFIYCRNMYSTTSVMTIHGQNGYNVSFCVVDS